MLRQKWSSLSEYVKEIKQTFSRYYNKAHGRRGFFWSDRFKSVIVEKGETLINCLAYIDLNPIRAGIVERPEDYRWNSLGYHLQTDNKDGFLSTDFGPVKCASLSHSELHRASLKEFNVQSEKERIRLYRKYVYETGAIQRSDQQHPQKNTDMNGSLLAEHAEGAPVKFATLLIGMNFTGRAENCSLILALRAVVPSAFRLFTGLDTDLFVYGFRFTVYS